MRRLSAAPPPRGRAFQRRGRARRCRAAAVSLPGRCRVNAGSIPDGGRMAVNSLLFLMAATAAPLSTPPRVSDRETLLALPPTQVDQDLGGGWRHPRGPNGELLQVAWPPNLNVVDGLVRCFGRPYAIAYFAARGRSRSEARRQRPVRPRAQVGISASLTGPSTTLPTAGRPPICRQEVRSALNLFQHPALRLRTGDGLDPETSSG